MENLFFLLGIALIAACGTSYFAKILKQPLILAYILTGFFLGPAVLGIITDFEPVRLMSEMGIVFLLFTVGLHLNLKNLKDLGFVSLMTGLGQVIIMTLAGMLISLYFGFSSLESLYIGIAIALSSTIIIVKMLGENNDINSLHGRISIGFLLVQDFIAIFVLILISGSSVGHGAFSGFLITMLKAVFLVFLVYFLTSYVLGPIFHWIARNQELLFLSSISYCFLLSIVSYYLGLSIEIGAFLAGVSLASLPYSMHIDAKIRPLRDFFIVVFFIVLGAEMSFAIGMEGLLPLIILSILVLLGTPLILMLIMGSMGYRKKTSFLVGLTVAQISEFSLILVALGNKLGHIGGEVVSLVTGVGVITITISAYMIKYGHVLYYKFEKYLTFFERKHPIDQYEPVDHDFENHIVIVGYHRVGYGIVNKLKEIGKNILVVDFDPDIVKQLVKEKTPCLYGDIADPEIMERAHLERAEIVISTAPDADDNLALMKKTRKLNKNAIVMIVAEGVEEALDLYESGADYVILPHLLGGNHASMLLEDINTNVNKLIEMKIEHIEELRKRQKHHPYHLTSKRINRK